MGIKQRQMKTVEETLMSRRKVDESGCWLYMGCPNSVRPRIRVDGRIMVVSRVAAHLWLGFDLDSELFICHKEDCSKRCFNPDHLYVGTYTDNLVDRHRIQG